jgi:ParB/RepB/Spo0J family partition protein
MEEFKLLPKSQLVASSTNPRKHFNEDQLIELSQDIKSHGIIEPLIVRIKPGSVITIEEAKYTDLSKFEVICGERRLRASMLIDLEFLPCRIMELDDDQVEEIQISENLQRVDVSPLDECDAFQKLIKKKKYSFTDLAIKFGKSEEYVFQRMRLSALDPEVKKLLEDDVLPITAAIKISSLPPLKQLEAVKRTVVTDGTGKKLFTSLRDLRVYFDNNILVPLRFSDFDTEDEKLCPQAGKCSTCNKRTGNNFFNDFGSDKCMDGDCYKDKTVTHYQNLQHKLKKEMKTEVVFAARHYGIDKEYKELGQVVDMISYAIVEKKAKDSVYAVFVGPNRAEVQTKPPVVHGWIQISKKASAAISKEEEKKVKKKEVEKKEKEVDINNLIQFHLYEQFKKSKKKFPLSTLAIQYSIIKILDTIKIQDPIFEDLIKRYNLQFSASEMDGKKWSDIWIDKNYQFTGNLISMDFDDIFLNVLKLRRDVCENLLNDLLFIEAQGNEKISQQFNSELDLKEAKRKASEEYKESLKK